MEQTIELWRVVDALSQEAGCPYVVAGTDGAVLASSRRPPVPCLREGRSGAFCVGAQAFSRTPKAGVVLHNCPKDGETHLAVSVKGKPGVVVLAELWLTGSARGVRARARRVARLLAGILREALPPSRREPGLFVEEIPSEPLRQAVRDGRVAEAGLHRMRARYGLSWRELEVLVLYYLTAYRPGIRVRTAVGGALGITEGTVREYVRRLRRKLRLRSRRSPELLAWARAEGLVGEVGR